MEQLGGRIVVESVVGTGSTFTVSLPRAGSVATDDDLDRDLLGPAAWTQGGHGETVLVVEDSDLLRNLMRSVLERAGYAVHVVDNGETAIEAIQANGPPAIVVADVEMPRMGGLELSRRVEKAYPGIPVLLVSGYAAEGKIDDLARREFLQKPFTPAQLTQRIGALLQR
jgi:CheY-like chemotaxis protein